MYRVDHPTGSIALAAPTAPTATPNRFYFGGNESLGQPATIVEAEHLNMITEELCNVVTASGQTLNKSLRNQLTTAVTNLISTNVPNPLPLSRGGTGFNGMTGNASWANNPTVLANTWPFVLFEPDSQLLAPQFRINTVTTGIDDVANGAMMGGWGANIDVFRCTNVVSHGINPPDLAPYFTFFRSRGTFMAPTQVLNNDSLGDVRWIGSIPGALSPPGRATAQINVYASTNHTATNFPGRMHFTMIVPNSANNWQALVLQPRLDGGNYYPMLSEVAGRITGGHGLTFYNSGVMLDAIPPVTTNYIWAQAGYAEISGTAGQIYLQTLSGAGTPRIEITGAAGGIIYSGNAPNVVGFGVWGGTNLSPISNGVSMGTIQWAPSDERLKHNIKAPECDPLADILRIDLKSYDLQMPMADASVEHDPIGFMAQQIRPFMPDCVIEEPEKLGGRLSVKIAPLLARCIGAIQQLAKESGRHG